MRSDSVFTVRDDLQHLQQVSHLTLSACLPVCPPVCLSACLSVCLSACLSVCRLCLAVTSVCCRRCLIPTVKPSKLCCLLSTGENCWSRSHSLTTASLCESVKEQNVSKKSFHWEQQPKILNNQQVNEKFLLSNKAPFLKDSKEFLMTLLMVNKSFTYTVETSYTDHVCPGQIHHYQRMVVFFLFLYFSAHYHLTDICIFITWI